MKKTYLTPEFNVYKVNVESVMQATSSASFDTSAPDEFAPDEEAAAKQYRNSWDNSLDDWDPYCDDMMDE